MQPGTRGYVILAILLLVPLASACVSTSPLTQWPAEATATSSVAQAAAGVETTALTPSGQTAVETSMPSPADETAVPTSPTPPSAPEVPATATPVPSPSSAPEPSPTGQPPDDVLVWESTIIIPSYPYEPYLRQGFDAQHGVPYLWLDRAAYGAPAGASVPKSLRAIVLENRYLQLTILPELGGRVYQCTFKPTGQVIFYHNAVLKPTSWGPLTREQNWWLAAGGMEWAFPVNEHGYEWGVPWSYSVERSAVETVVTLRDGAAADRPGVSVEVALAPGKAYFAVRPRITNPTASSITYQYWTNAMLTLGGSSMSPSTKFVYPTHEVIIHSAGPGSGLPEEKSRVSWPQYDGRDMAWYSNWVDWLGFFVPQPAQEFVGAYNHATELGVARIFPRQEVPGVKLFAWGQGSPYASEYTDDGSQYFEIWGGPNRSFWPEDDNRLAPGESKAWSEYWYPFSRIGGLGFANREAALSLGVDQGLLTVGLATTSQRAGTVVVALAGQELFREVVAVGPDSPYVHALVLPAGAPSTAAVIVRFLGPGGEVIAEHQQDLHLAEY